MVLFINSVQLEISYLWYHLARNTNFYCKYSTKCYLIRMLNGFQVSLSLQYILCIEGVTQDSFSDTIMRHLQYSVFVSLCLFAYV